MLEFSCPKCSESVKAAEDQAGESIICPKCNETIRVPGSKAKSVEKGNDEWSVFDEDEKFIEESVAQKPDVKYRTAEDDREALVDDDEAAAKLEELEEQAAVTEALERNRSMDFGTGASSDMTVDEQMEQEAKFQKELESLPEDSPLRQKKSWDREAVDSPDPIRLENQPTSSNSIGVKCHVCESVTLVSETKAGNRIVCSDCGSDIEVPTRAEEQEEKQSNKQEWERWAQQEKADESEKKPKSKIVDELFVEPPESDENEYGLAPAPENLLTPVAPVYDLDEVEGLAENESFDSLRRSPAETPVSEPGNSGSSSRIPEDLERSALFDEMEAERAVKFERLPWAQHIFGILSDPGFLLRAVTSVAVMALGYSIYHFSAGMAEMDGDRFAKIVSFLGKFVQMWAFPFLPIAFLMVCWVGQKVLNSTIVGDKKLPDLEGSTLIEWLSNSLFVAVGLVIGAFPGALLGGLLWTQFEEWEGFWCIPALGTASAMLISPMMILSSLQNSSPFKIFSQKISDSIMKKSDAWVEYYIPSSILALVTGSLWLLGMTEIWFVVVLMFLLVNVCFGLYFRMLGRLMGTIVSKKGGKKKKKEKTEDE